MGNPLSAVAALLYALTHRNPGDPPTNVVMDWRKSFSSSTMETDIISLKYVFGDLVEINNKSDVRSLPGRGLYHAVPANISQSLAHIAQAVAGCGCQLLRLRFSFQRMEAFAVVSDGD